MGAHILREPNVCEFMGDNELEHVNQQQPTINEPELVELLIDSIDVDCRVHTDFTVSLHRTVE